MIPMSNKNWYLGGLKWFQPAPSREMAITNTTPYVAPVQFTHAELDCAIVNLITAKLTRRGYSDALINTTISVARTLHTKDHTALRAMRLALGMAERLHLSSSTVNHGPHAA